MTEEETERLDPDTCDHEWAVHRKHHFGQISRECGKCGYMEFTLEDTFDDEGDA